MSEILKQIKNATRNWPRRAGERLFIHEADSEVNLIERPNELFGWLGSKVGKPPLFYQKPGFHTQSEIFAELKRTVKSYRHIELFPHWPPHEDHYYTCKIPKPGDGSHFERLLDFFSPESPEDRDLIKLFFATAFWGGKGGQRPAFLITADCGRGAGKSALASILGLLAGGMVDISCGEHVESIKKRLLSKDGVTRRVVLLDNLKSYKFSWGEYESLITASEISGWMVYVGNASRPNNCLWCITQNGIGLSTDMAQRCCIIKLAKPDFHGCWLEDVQNFVNENRDAIIADIIGFLQSEKHALTNQSRWGSWETEVLCGLSKPERVQRVILKRQQEADSELDESHITEDYFRKQIEIANLNSDTDHIFIPSQLASRWYNEANNDRQKTATISRIMRQHIREGKFKNLQETSLRRRMRGLLWVGKNADPDASISYDLENVFTG